MNIVQSYAQLGGLDPQLVHLYDSLFYDLAAVLCRVYGVRLANDADFLFAIFFSSFVYLHIRPAP